MLVYSVFGNVQLNTAVAVNTSLTFESQSFYSVAAPDARKSKGKAERKATLGQEKTGNESIIQRQEKAERIDASHQNVKGAGASL